MPILLGIDVGSTSVKAVCVRSFYTRLEVAGAATVDLGPNMSEGEAIKLASAAALGPKSPTADGIAIAIDGAKTAVRTLTLPKSVEKQLAEVLPSCSVRGRWSLRLRPRAACRTSARRRP